MPISHHEFITAVDAAIRAPSQHNSQPWRFCLDGDQVHVLADPSRTPVADAGAWAMRIACGAATYNLQLAFAVAGQPMDVHWRPLPSERCLMATLRPALPRPPTPWQQRLFRAIPNRRSNHRGFRSQPVPPDTRAALIEAANDEGAWLELVVGRIPVAAVAEVARAANRVLQRNSAYVAELASWTCRVADAVDGVPADADGFSTDPDDLLPQRPVSDLIRTAGTDLEDDPLIAVLGTAGDSPNDHLRTGYALQRVLLTITDHGLAGSMLSQPIEVPSAQEQLRIALGRHGTPQMVLRVGYADPATDTPRRPVSDVIGALEGDPMSTPARAIGS
ncbi:MAG TPA: nitroreductase family protein [Jiangellales bacterium]|nr:nitroreductase family protein [Jiangellales bacterium]